MKHRGIMGWLVVGMIVGVMSSACAQSVRLLTEDDPPFNFIAQDRVVSGLSTELVREMFRRAGIDQTIEVMPWVRAYNLALSDPQVCLFSTTRTGNREKLFKWVGPLLQNDWAVFAGPRSPAGVKTLEALRPYVIGGYRDDAVAQFLLERGYRLELVGNDQLNLRKLQAGRIDFWASGIYHARYLTQQANLPPLRLVTVFSTSYLYLACHPATPDGTIQGLGLALATMQRDGYLENMRRRYLSP